VGGRPAAPGAFPTYAIPFGGGCGATLIHEDILITAAHCGENTDNNGLFLSGGIHIGGNMADGSDARENNSVAASCLHPECNSQTSKNDVMLVKLSQPSQAPVTRMNANVILPAAGESVKVIGFGVLNWEGVAPGPSSPDLMEVELNVIDCDMCDAACTNNG